MSAPEPCYRIGPHTTRQDLKKYFAFDRPICGRTRARSRSTIHLPSAQPQISTLCGALGMFSLIREGDRLGTGATLCCSYQLTHYLLTGVLSAWIATHSR